MWIILTVVVFLIARKIAVKANHPLVNPLLISIAVIIPLLTYLKVPFDTYYADNEVFSLLLQPAVVAFSSSIGTMLHFFIVVFIWSLYLFL